MGHAPSQARLGFLLANVTEARKWFTEAAMQGEVAAMEWLELNANDAAWGSAAPADGPHGYLVSGAGRTECNGFYARDGEYGGYPLFKNGQWWLLVQPALHFSCWYITC